MSPDYDVTAVWTEQYCSTVRIIADDLDEARQKAREIWMREPDFISSAEFETTRLLGFEVYPVDYSRVKG